MPPLLLTVPLMAYEMVPDLSVHSWYSCAALCAVHTHSQTQSSRAHTRTESR